MVKVADYCRRQEQRYEKRGKRRPWAIFDNETGDDSFGYLLLVAVSRERKAAVDHTSIV